MRGVEIAELWNGAVGPQLRSGDHKKSMYFDSEIGRLHFLLHGLRLMVRHLGGFGLFSLSFLDSTPLFLPFGNDLMMIAMVARDHDALVYYALMATSGSVLGCLLVDVLSRKGGEKGFELTVSPRKFIYLQKVMKRKAVWVVAISTLLPPPFPFTVVVAGAAAFQYPRRQLLSVVFFGRLARFMIEGVLAIYLSRQLLRIIKSPAASYFAIGLILVSVLGSTLVLVSRTRRSKRGFQH